MDSENFIENIPSDENFMENIPSKDIYYFIDAHIKDLVNIKKSLNEKMFKEFQSAWDQEVFIAQLNKNDLLAWRGAKMQVINAKKGLNDFFIFGFALLSPKISFHFLNGNPETVAIKLAASKNDIITSNLLSLKYLLIFNNLLK